MGGQSVIGRCVRIRRLVKLLPHLALLAVLADLNRRLVLCTAGDHAANLPA